MDIDLYNDGTLVATLPNDSTVTLTNHGDRFSLDVGGETKDVTGVVAETNDATNLEISIDGTGARRLYDADGYVEVSTSLSRETHFSSQWAWSTPSRYMAKLSISPPSEDVQECVLHFGLPNKPRLRLKVTIRRNPSKRYA